MSNNTNSNSKGAKNQAESYMDGMVHFILSHSYTVFMLAVVLGLILDVFIPVEIFHKSIYQYIGIVMIILGSIVIYWAQSTSNCTKKEEKAGASRNFARGPYRYNRSPTHIGLSVMTLGLGFILNSAFSILLVIIAYCVTKMIFLKKEEILLEKKYGEIYCAYKKKVRNWL